MHAYPGPRKHVKLNQIIPMHGARNMLAHNLDMQGVIRKFKERYEGAVSIPGVIRTRNMTSQSPDHCN